MIREIIKPTKENYTLKIPKEYINKKIEIILRPYEKRSLFGALKKYANPELIEKEKEIAWEKIIKEKEDNNDLSLRKCCAQISSK